MNVNHFDEIVGKLPHNIARAIGFLPFDIKEKICEIRLNASKPLILVTPQKMLFAEQSGGVCDKCRENVIKTSKEEVNECFFNLCNHSVFAHTKEIKEGYLAVGYGCRAGICGKFDDDNIVDVTSINIRISREVTGCGDCLLDYVCGGILIAGPPSSGKTTILRDLVKSLSNGKGGSCHRVCVIDSREEITVGYDMGLCTDSLIVKDKSKGIEMGLRTMSPMIIAFDEIGSLEELEGVKNSLNAGVTAITTAHVGSVEELKKRNVTRQLIKSGAVKHIALLSGNLGEKPTVYKAEEIMNDF